MKQLILQSLLYEDKPAMPRIAIHRLLSRRGFSLLFFHFYIKESSFENRNFNQDVLRKF